MKQISIPFLILGGSVSIAVIVIVVTILATAPPSLSGNEKIVLYNTLFSQNQGFAKVSEIPPNSMGWFTYPPSVKFDVKENTFQTFILVRLAPWLGGAEDDLSAFRAYSAVDLASHCVIKYWPQQGRQQLEDPCTSPGYRVIDGVSLFPGMKILRAPSTGVLPRLDLTIDNDGYLRVMPPTLTPDKNGAIGFGRNISEEEIVKSSEFILKSYKDWYKVSLDIPVILQSGEILIDIMPLSDGAKISYADPDSATRYAKLYISNCNCKDPLEILNEQHRYEKYKQLWEIQSQPVILTGQALYTGEDKVAGSFKPFIFNFVKDGYLITFEINQDFELSSNVFLENFFEGAKQSDMHRIS